MPLTLDTLSEHCRINKYHICRLFQKSEQTSQLAYLKDRRVEATIALLRTTDLPIHEVGGRCGYESPRLEFPYHAIYFE
ncbi:helix-turn-helix domain-containing protein [Paenibacillus sp. V4I7]|uniref:helix-turn-helix domain-containing protein n=1 Tax=Paenibacillus sp. V4I7 TaxID=3042307 RepID=UPI0027D78E1C|nr:helix-turn-helix domain-containing protein [Paenibacillus sp. V4I7]